MFPRDSSPNPFSSSSSISTTKNHRVSFHQEQPTTHRKNGIYYFSHLERKHLWYRQRLNWRGNPRRRPRTPSLRYLHLQRCDTTFRRHFDARRPTSPKHLSRLLCCFEQRPQREEVHRNHHRKVQQKSSCADAMAPLRGR